MVNYVCRTCLYVCDNEFSFRRLEKVKQVLELFVPEIRSFVGKYALICEQCYYFLKNVEKFKIKCIETQKKLCSMNIETIKDAHNTVLQSVTNEVPIKRFKPYYASSTITSENNNTFPNILNTSAKPVPPIHEEINKKNETLVLNTSVADDLLQLLDHKDDVMDLKSFRKFAVKGIVSNKESEETSNNNDIKESSAELVLNYDEDEYMTRGDLVSAGILSDDSNNSVDKEDPNSEDDSEIVAIEISDDNESDDNVKRVEIKISDSCKERQSDSQIKKQGAVLSSTENEFMSVPIPMTATVKKELKEDENPGSFKDVYLPEYDKLVAEMKYDPDVISIALYDYKNEPKPSVEPMKKIRKKKTRIIKKNIKKNDKKRWSKEEIEIFKQHFDPFIKSNRYPSGKQIKRIIEETKLNRSISQVRSKIQNKINLNLLGKY